MTNKTAAEMVARLRFRYKHREDWGLEVTRFDLSDEQAARELEAWAAERNTLRGFGQKMLEQSCDNPSPLTSKQVNELIDETNKAEEPMETQTECYEIDCPKHCKTEPIGVCKEGECVMKEKTPAPTPTSKNIADQLFRLIDDDFDVISWNWEKALSIIDSALTQAAEKARREAAEEFCRQCSERDEVDDGTLVCEFDWKGDACKKRAAILGHGEGKP